MIELASAPGSPRREISMAQIVEATALVCGIPVHEIMGRLRFRPVVRARQIACVLARDLPHRLGNGQRNGKVSGHRSLTAIARFFDRDHTTILHGLQAVEEVKYERPWGRDGLTVGAAVHEISRALHDPDHKSLWTKRRAAERRPVKDASYAAYVETQRRAGLPVLP